MSLQRVAQRVRNEMERLSCLAWLFLFGLFIWTHYRVFIVKDRSEEALLFIGLVTFALMAQHLISTALEEPTGLLPHVSKRFHPWLTSPFSKCVVTLSGFIAGIAFMTTLVLIGLEYRARYALIVSGIFLVVAFLPRIVAWVATHYRLVFAQSICLWVCIEGPEEFMHLNAQKWSTDSGIFILSATIPFIFLAILRIYFYRIDGVLMPTHSRFFDSLQEKIKSS